MARSRCTKIITFLSGFILLLLLPSILLGNGINPFMVAAMLPFSTTVVIIKHFSGAISKSFVDSMYKPKVFEIYVTTSLLF